MRSAAAVAPVAAGTELIVLVGGYQSCACKNDPTFNALQGRLDSMPGFKVFHFGEDPRFPYDTYGSIGPNAINLRDQIRALKDGYSVVHIVTHSMGGVVADQAFANGLSRDDGVVSYVSWSAPHDGSDAARGLALAHTLTGSDETPLREGLLWLRMEPDSPAARDLARVHAPVPPAGIVRLDLREASDALVTGRDARDPGVPSRILTGPSPEGHGGILSDPQALDLTIGTIATRRIPPDERSRVLQAAAAAESDRVGGMVLLAICVLTIAVCVTGFVRRAAPTPYLDALRGLLPRATRRPSP